MEEEAEKLEIKQEQNQPLDNKDVESVPDNVENFEEPKIYHQNDIEELKKAEDEQKNPGVSKYNANSIKLLHTLPIKASPAAVNFSKREIDELLAANAELIMDAIRDQKVKKNENFVDSTTINKIYQLEQNLMKILRNSGPKLMIEEQMVNENRETFERYFKNKKRKKE